MKLIHANFPTRCGACKKVIAKGERFYWEPSTKDGNRCLSCQGGAGNSPAPPATPAAAPVKFGKYYPDFVIEWAELKPLIRAATGEGTKLSGWRNASYRERFRGEYPYGADQADSDFHGFTRGQMHRWVTEGYKTTAIQGLSGLTPPIREKRRMQYVEDGDELLIDRVLAGEDNYMARWTKREVIPGVRLNIELDASAGSSTMLRDYQRWIAQAIYALQVSGVDCEISIFTLSRNLFREQGGNVTRQAVRVKKFGESSVDFYGFSAMFSPGAFRGIMFSLFALHADRQNLTLRGHGSGVTNEWGCRYNAETKSIDVACHWTATEFPESRMTALLRTAIEDMKRGW